jgi:hypothetical protein
VDLRAVTSSGSLVDARIRVESVPGLTDFVARSGGEGEVGALGIGTYWFAESVREITLHPLPASPGNTTVVETDAGRVHFGFLIGFHNSFLGSHPIQGLNLKDLFTTYWFRFAHE